MKKLCIILLALALLIPCIAGLTAVPAEAAAAKDPIYMFNGTSSNGTIPYVYKLYELNVELKVGEDGSRNVTLKYGSATGDAAATALKTDMNTAPAGARYLRINLQSAFLAAAEDVVYFDSAVAPIKAALTNFFTRFKSVGGQLDGVFVEEYIAHMDKTWGETSPTSWYLHRDHYSKEGGNRFIYRDIVENPLYETTIRPMLVERGFKFYPQEEAPEEKPEIFTIYPYWETGYAGDPLPRRIWDLVMKERMAQHVNEAVYEPLIASFPNAILTDHYSRDTYAWSKEVNGVADPDYTGGNWVKAGNASCYDISLRIQMDGQTFPGVNDVSMKQNAFFQVLWDTNQFKNICEATDTGEVYAWLANHQEKNWQELQDDPAYYTETIYHLGLQGVDGFFGYIWNVADNPAVQVIGDALIKLNLLIGTADRQAIDLPLSWNYDFVLSGATAGGKAYWRITPDTDLVSLEDFKVSDTNPTFTVNGQTVTFPGGKILPESDVIKIGTCGYWVETAADVRPTITCSADRYEQQPPYIETFDSPLEFYNASTKTGWWTQEGTPVAVENGKLVASAASTLQNITRPQLIKAGDDFAPQQGWKITVTIPAGLNSDAEINLFTYTKKDTGFKITNNKVFYDDGGNSRELLDIDFAAGGTYTFVREVDFTVKGMYQCDYYVYDAEGKLLASKVDVAMLDVTLPYASLNMSWNRLRSNVLMDNYMLYPMGHTATFELYDVTNGMEVPATGNKTADVGYRMTWLNATDKTEKAEIIAAHYDANGNVVEEVLETIIMAPGTDGVVTGVAKLKSESIYVYLKEYDKAYILTIGNSGRGAEGIGKYRTGETVTVNAGNRPGYEFVGWTCDKNVTFSDPTNPVTTFVMPEGDTVVSATWKLIVVEGVKPFVMTNWGGVDEALFSNIRQMPVLQQKLVNGQMVITYKDSTDIKRIAQLMKEEMEGRPEGTRIINGAGLCNTLLHYASDIMYLDSGVAIVRDWMEAFLTEYKAIGGQLDGIALDMEYYDARYWYINTNHFSGGTNNRFIYSDIVSNPHYETRLRPLLEERGFKFWPTPSTYTPEIYSIYPQSGDEYAQSREIWDAASQCLMATYQNEAIGDVLLKYYPDAMVNDYRVRDVRGWLKPVGEDGGAYWIGGNRDKMGNASSYNVYSYAPTLSYERLAGADWIYRKTPGYNKAVYEDDPYNMFMWDVNHAKIMYEATPEKKISMWYAAYCYSPERPGSTSFTPYYAESMLHVGLMDPYPFLGFIVGNHDGRMETTDEYNLALQVASDILSELTRVVGAEDRKHIELPYTWNSGYILTGMYAGGYNYWRITPDTTDGMTKEAFLISGEGEDPTFSINGQTVTFPGGEILEDGFISEVGTCGYWVKTATDVIPKVTYAANRYEMTPSFMENYEQYQIGAKYEGTMVRPNLTWEVWAANGAICEIREDPSNPNNKVLALGGLTSLKNVRMPQNITAGDSFAKQQVWELTLTLPENIPADTQMNLLGIFAEDFSDDTGLQIRAGKVYYDLEGTPTEVPGVVLTGGTYVIKREVDFRDEANFLSSYYIYDAEGAVVCEVKNVPILELDLPVNGIGVTINGFANDPVLMDDFKIYPTGLTAEFEVYNADNGIMLEDMTAAQTSNGAYRLSWLNATNETATKVVVAAYYDANGNLVKEEVVKTIELTANADGIETGIVENTVEGQSLKLYLKNAGEGSTPGGDDPSTPGATNPSNPGGDTEDNGNMGLIIGIVAGAVVLIAAVVVVLLVLKKKKK